MGCKRILVVCLGLLGLASITTATDLTDGLTFVAITPCRIIDTRNGQGFSDQAGPPALVANAVRTFQITGTTTGTPNQCGIPDYALAISANFTAAGFSGAGDIRAFPAGGSLPLTSILNYKLETIANAVTIPLGPSGSGHNGITVRADVSSTQLIVDVNGYYLANRFWAFVAADGTLLRNSHAVSVTKQGGAGSYEVVFDRDITPCGWVGNVGRAGGGGVPNAGFVTVVNRSGLGSGLFVQTFNTAGTLTDNEFVVFVSCP